MDQGKIGKFIAALRREQGWTQEILGEKLGVTNKTVSRWETGSYMPDIEMLQLLGQTFGVSINELLAGQRLTDAEFREKAEENVTAALRTSPFSRREQEGFWKKKWKKDHLFDMISTGILTLLLYWILPRMLNASAPLLWCTLPITAIVEYGVFRSRMMTYAERKLYDENPWGEFPADRPGEDTQQDPRSGLWVLCAVLYAAAGVGMLIVLAKSHMAGDTSETVPRIIVCVLFFVSAAIYLLRNKKE